MIQTNKKVEVRILRPSEGYYLTQASDEVDVKDRVFLKTLVLALTDLPENWKEISIEEANVIKEEQDKIFNEMTQRKNS